MAMREVNINGMKMTIDVDETELLNDYVMEVSNLIGSMKVQTLQTGEDSSVSLNNIYTTYLNYREKYGIVDNEKDLKRIKEELVEGLKSRGLTIYKKGNRDYIDKE